MGHPNERLFDLAPGGACHAKLVTKFAVRSYRTFSPLPFCNGGIFSVALSKIRIFQALPGALPEESGLSSACQITNSDCLTGSSAIIPQDKPLKHDILSTDPKQAEIILASSDQQVLLERLIARAIVVKGKIKCLF